MSRKLWCRDMTSYGVIKTCNYLPKSAKHELILNAKSKLVQIHYRCLLMTEPQV